MFSIPNIEGQLPTQKYVIYFSCDDNYYRDYGVPLIKSIVSQLPWLSIHCHLIIKNDIELYKHNRVTHTYETVTEEFISSIPDATITKNGQKKDKLIVYYSCARFLQIDKIFKPYQHVLMIDCDSLLFNTFEQTEFKELTETTKCMRKPKRPELIIASALSLGTGDEGVEFRKKVKNVLLEKISRYGFYWFIDQDMLQDIFNNTNYNKMPLYWNTWSFKKPGYFRTGKGDKKDYDVFKKALDKWKSYK